MENYIKYNYISINKMPRYKDFLVKQMQLSGEIPPRSIEKLDEDLSVAFQKMEKITRIMKVLPQIDCGACGTPSCQALAQDVVQGKAKLNQCIFMQKILTRKGCLPRKNRWNYRPKSGESENLKRTKNKNKRTKI